MEIDFGYKLLTFFVKSSNLNVWLVPQDASNKQFLCFVSEDFASWKKSRNVYTRMLEFTFSGARCDWLKGGFRRAGRGW